MSTFNGKVVWQNYLEPEDIPLKKNTTIERGDLFTVDNDGFAITATLVSAGPTVYRNGVYQALSSGKIGNTANDADGDVEIQAAKIRSRIAIACAANLVIGNKVQTVNNSSNKVTKATAAPGNYTVLGTVHSFDEQPEKRKSVDGDIAVIDFGIGVA